MVVEVVPDPPGVDEFQEVVAGGRHDADIDMDRVAPPDAQEGLMLEGAQEPRLQAQIGIGDVLEEQGPAVGLLERAEVDRAAVLAPEELGAGVLGGEPGHGHGDERCRGPRALVVEIARQDFFAGARLAGDKDRGRVRGDAPQLLAQERHRRAAPDGLGGQRGMRPEPDVLAASAPPLRGPAGWSGAAWPSTGASR